MADKLTVREYKPGEHLIVYIPNNPLAVVQSQCFHPDDTCVKRTWTRLGNEQVFTLKVDFNLLGDWLFIVKENGQFTTTLKARIVP